MGDGVMVVSSLKVFAFHKGLNYFLGWGFRFLKFFLKFLMGVGFAGNQFLLIF